MPPSKPTKPTKPKAKAQAEQAAALEAAALEAAGAAAAEAAEALDRSVTLTAARVSAGLTREELATRMGGLDPARLARVEECEEVPHRWFFHVAEVVLDLAPGSIDPRLLEFRPASYLPTPASTLPPDPKA